MTEWKPIETRNEHRHVYSSIYLSCHHFEYRRLTTETVNIQKMYPAVKIYRPMLIEAIIKHWYSIGAPVLPLHIVREKGSVIWEGTYISDRLNTFIVRAANRMFYQDKGNVVTKTQLIQRVLNCWINHGRSDIFQYLKASSTDTLNKPIGDNDAKSI